MILKELVLLQKPNPCDLVTLLINDYHTNSRTYKK